MGRRLIFIVDDDPVFIKVLHHNFEMQKIKSVLDFQSGEGCIKALGKKPGLVLLDFSLDRLNGLDVLKQIKELSPRTKVIILTALKDEEVKNKCLAAGASDYINKDEDGLTYLREKIIPQYRPSGIFSLFK